MTNEREGPAWDELARTAALASDEEGVDEVRQLLVFEVMDAAYAVPVDRVREIVRIRPITPIPRAPEEVRGVISLRGEILQVVDLRRRLGLAPREPSRSSRIIVVHLEDGRISGMLVDAVREVMRVGADDFTSPSGGEALAVEALCARGDEFVSLISLDRALQVEDDDD